MTGGDTVEDSFLKPQCLVYFYYNLDLFVKGTQKALGPMRK